MTAVGAHHASRMVSDTWLTPPEIINALGSFDLDPCAAPEPRPWPTAARHITRPCNGLTASWAGRIWCNPPYSRDVDSWMRRMAAHQHGTALVFARTETTWFAETVWRQATAALFLHGRLHFCRANGKRAAGNSGGPSVLVAYGADDAATLRDSGLDGTFVEWNLPPAVTRRPGLFEMEDT